MQCKTWTAGQTGIRKETSRVCVTGKHVQSNEADKKKRLSGRSEQV